MHASIPELPTLNSELNDILLLVLLQLGATVSQETTINLLIVFTKSGREAHHSVDRFEMRVIRRRGGDGNLRPCLGIFASNQIRFDQWIPGDIFNGVDFGNGNRGLVEDVNQFVRRKFLSNGLDRMI